MVKHLGVVIILVCFANFLVGVVGIVMVVTVEVVEEEEEEEGAIVGISSGRSSSILVSV